MAVVRKSLRLVLVAILAVAAGCGGDDENAACADLTGALAGARAGDEVRLGACRVEGSFTVPAGVTLAGAAMDASTVAGSVTLEDGAALADLAVHAERGTAIEVRGGSARLTRVDVTGPITPENADTIPPTADPTMTATHGIVLDGAGTEAAPVTLEDVRVSGFAAFGVLAVDSVVEWTSGSASDNLGVGIAADGGSIRLVDVEACRTLSGLRTLPAYGVMLTGGEATTSNLSSCDNRGIGVVQDSATVVHSDLVASGNSEPAVWAQRGGRLELAGTGTVVSDNGGAGIVVARTPDVLIRDAQIDATRITRRLVDDGALRNVDIGDGIQVVLDGPTSGIRIEDVVLDGNARAGILFDLPDGGSVDDATLGAVTVVATDTTAYGVIAQTPSAPVPSGAWDASVTREGVAVMNDAAFAGGLDVVGIIGPMYLPPTR